MVMAEGTHHHVRASKPDVHLGKIMDTLKKAGIHPIPHDPLDLNLKSHGKEKEIAQDIWDENKAERNALIGGFIEESWAHVHEHAYVNGKLLTPPKVSANNLDNLRIHTKDLFRDAISSWYTKHDSRTRTIHPDKQTFEDKAFRRYKKIIDFAKRNNVHIPGLDMGNTADIYTRFITRGVGTAADASWGVIEVIPHVFKNKFGRKITQEEYRNILSHSFSILADFSIDHLEQGPKILSELSDFMGKSFIVSSFELVQRSNGDWALQVKPDILEELRKKHKKIGKSKQTGCPALAAKSKNGNNVVAAFWRLCLDLTEAYIMPGYPSKP